jgi:hypothetical protein
MYKDWIVLYLRDIVDDPFHMPVAHTNCLQLFDTFVKSRIRGLHEVDTVPLTLFELVRALQLRRASNGDSCFCSIRNRQTSWRTVLWEHCYFGAQTGWGSSEWECFAGDEIYCADPIEIFNTHRFCTVSYASTVPGQPRSREPTIKPLSERRSQSTVRAFLLDLSVSSTEKRCRRSEHMPQNS